MSDVSSLLSQTLLNLLSEVSLLQPGGGFSVRLLPAQCDAWGLIKALVLKLYSKFLLIRLVSSWSSRSEGRARAGKRSCVVLPGCACST